MTSRTLAQSYLIFIPTEEYPGEDASGAIKDAIYVVDATRELIKDRI